MLFSSHTITHNHDALLHNSPSKDENGLSSEQEKAVLISSHTLKHKHKHSVLLYNSPPAFRIGLGKEPKKEMLISSHTLTKNAMHCFTTHPLKLIIGMGRE